MPMPKEDRICRNCIYFSNIPSKRYFDKSLIGILSECRYNQKFEFTHEMDWCGNGSWKAYSEVLKRDEWYSREDDETSYEEHRKLSDPEYQYYIVVGVEGKSVEVEAFRELPHAEDKLETWSKIDSYDARLFRIWYSGGIDIWNVRQLSGNKEK